MVARVFVVLIALAGLTVPTIGFGATPSFHLVITSAEAEYGKPVVVDLFARHLRPDLSTLDLSGLNRDFVVETRDDVERDSEASRQHWRIRLYPRRPGELRIPSLVFHGHKTDPVELMVRPARHGKDNTPILVKSDVGKTSVWINQAVRVTLQVESDSLYARLETETAKQDGVEIVPLPHTRTTRVLNGVQRTLHYIGWVLYPQTTGTLAIQLPAAKYRRDGVVTHRFYPPKIELHVRALPAFVPPTMPIGRMLLDVSLPDRYFLLKRELAFLTLRIRGESPPGQRSSSVLRQLRSNSTVSFYPPRSMAKDDDSATKNAKADSYQVPFAPKTMGLIALPSVRLQYFDPSTGKIETRTQPLGRFVVISPWVAYIGLAGLLIALYKLANVLYGWAERNYRVYRAYRTALNRFQRADSPQAVKAGLMEIARGECWPTNLTVAVWADYWVTRYPRLSSVSESVLRLEGWLYGPAEATIEEIRPCLINACYWRMPLLKISALMRQGTSLAD